MLEIKKLIYLLIGIVLVILLLMFVSYPSVKISAQEAETVTLTLTWEPNTESNMSHYIVYWGKESRNYDYNSGNIGLVTIYSKEFVPPYNAKTTYYFAVTAVNDANLESDFSNEVFWEFDTRLPPAPPQGLRWYQKVVSWIVKHLIFWA